MGLNGLLPGALHRYSEFINGLTGACGPNSLSMARDWSTQTYNGNQTYQVVRDLLAAKILTDTNGTSDPAQIHAGALHYGLPVTYFQDWEQPDPNWQAEVYSQLDAGHIVILFVHAGQALVDWKTGNGENASHLQNHVICLCGKWQGGVYAGVQRPEGCWALDGDNYDVGDVTQYYPLTVLTAALPAAVIGIASKVVAPAPAPTPTPGGNMAIQLEYTNGVITGAHDTVNGNHVGGGVAQDINKHPNMLTGSSINVGETYLGEGESIAVVRGNGGMGLWTYSAASGVKEYLDGDVVKAVNDLFNNWHTAADALTKLQQQIANTPAPTPTPAPTLDPAIATDLAGCQSDAADLVAKLSDIASKLPK